MSKRLDITQITNELSEGSAFFRPAAKPEEREVPSLAPAKLKEPAEKPLTDYQPA